MTAIANRYDFVLIFDVKDGNPNGDPDAGNMPRLDPQTNQGFATDVSIKRKIRDYVDLVGGEGNAIFVRSREPLNPKIAAACEPTSLPDFKKPDGGWDTNKAKNRSQQDIKILQDWLCKQYYDIRSFGAVLSTGPNAGQIRGPIQISFARSVEPILIVESTITRVADVDKEEGEMGRKYTVPYGLYRSHGFISAKLAERTGFSDADLNLLRQAVASMFEHDRSAARGEMAMRKAIAFKHANALGNAHAHALFERVKIGRNVDGEFRKIDRRLDNLPPAREFSDYKIEIGRNGLPDGVEIEEWV